MGIAEFLRMNPTPQPQPRLQSGLRVVDVGEFVSMNIPARQVLIAPWLLAQSLAMIHAPRGIGKTHVSLGVAHAVATGSTFLGWTAPEPRRVLFIDGEMSASGLQQRYRAIQDQTDVIPEPDYLRIVTPDLQSGAMPDLATDRGQHLLNAQIQTGTDLIVVDNISTLVRSGKENEAESWQPVQDWALRHRAAGRSVLFVHHSGKGGAQRGTSRREDVLDTVIALKRPEGYRPENGAEFEVHFEKSRGFFGADAAPILAKLHPPTPGNPGGWSVQEVESDHLDRIVQLFKQGKSGSEIAADIGCHKSTVSRCLKSARENGQLPNDKSDG